MKTLLALLLCNALLTVSAHATTYYVAKTGNDTNPCTLEAPCLTILQGTKKLAAGDTLFVGAGTYVESIQTGPTRTMNIPSGTSWENFTRISAMPLPEGGYEPVILRRGDSTPKIRFEGGTSWRPEGVRYIQVEGFIADGEGRGFVVALAAPNCGSEADAPDHIRLLNNEIRNGANSGISIGQWSHDHEIIGNYVHHNGDSDLDHGMYFSGDRQLVRGNEWAYNSGYGLQNYHSHEDPCARMSVDSIIENNYIHHNKSGVTAQNKVAAALIRNNVVVDNTSIGINVGSTQFIYNNTAYRNGGAGIQILGNTLGVNTGMVVNNITDGLTRYQYGKPENIHHNFTAPYDALFVDALNNDFRLVEDAEVIDAGLVLAEVPYDADGIERPFGLSADLGAYEYVPAATQLAATALIASSTASPYPGYTVDKLFNGVVDVATDGFAKGLVAKLFVNFDLGQPHRLTQARLFGDVEGNWISVSYTILVRDDPAAAWVVAGNSPANGLAWFDMELNAEARYVRLEINGAATGTQAREFELYGLPLP